MYYLHDYETNECDEADIVEPSAGREMVFRGKKGNKYVDMILVGNSPEEALQKSIEYCQMWTEHFRVAKKQAEDQHGIWINRAHNLIVSRMRALEEQLKQ